MAHERKNDERLRYQLLKQELLANRAAGNEILRQLAEIARKRTARRDRFVARCSRLVGGENSYQSTDSAM